MSDSHSSFVIHPVGGRRGVFHSGICFGKAKALHASNHIPMQFGKHEASTVKQPVAVAMQVGEHVDVLA